MRMLVAALIVLIGMGSAGAAWAESDKKILKRLDAIETKLEELETTIGSNAALNPIESLKKSFQSIKDNQVSGQIEEKRLTVNSAKFLAVIDWKATPVKQQNKSVAMQFTLVNLTGRAISIIDGNIKFEDKLGEEIALLSIDRDIDIKSNEQKVLGGEYSNLFSPNIRRLVTLDRKFIDVSLSIKKLLFSNGEVIEIADSDGYKGPSRDILDRLKAANEEASGSKPTASPQQSERKKKFALNRIATLLDRAKKEDHVDNNGGFVQPLTISEVAAVRAKIETCWSMPGGVHGAENFVVRIRFALNPNGSFRDAPKIIDQGSRAGNDDFYRTASEAALRAVQKCEPYDMLPRAKYKRWQDMEMTFDPKQMMGG